MKVLKNYFYNAAYQLFKVIIPFFTIPYLSRILGPQGIGINSFTTSVLQYFVLIGDLGITMYGSRKVAYVRDNKYKLTQTFYEIMFLQVLTMSVAYVCFFVFLYFTKSYRPYYLAQSIVILSTALDISWFYNGIENFKVIAVRNFIIRIIILICIFTFVKSYSDLLLYIILSVSSFLIGNMTLFYRLHNYIGRPNIRCLNIFKHLKPSIMLFIPEVAVQVYWVLNKTMLGSLDSVKASGFFDQSDKTIKIVLAVITASGTVVLPHIANSFIKGHKKQTFFYLKSSFILVTALAIPMTFGLSAIAPKFVPLFFSNKFLIVSPIIIWESIIIIFIGWSNVIGTQYLVPTNQIHGYTISVILGAIVNVIFNLLLITLFGVIGAVISSDLSEFSVTVYQLYVIRHQVKLTSLFNDFYKYLFAGILMFIIVFILGKLTPLTWVALISEIFVGILSYFLIIFICHANMFSIIQKLRKD